MSEACSFNLNLIVKTIFVEEKKMEIICFLYNFIVTCLANTEKAKFALETKPYNSADFSKSSK